MDIECLRDFSEIELSEWDALLSHSASAVPFLRYGYLQRWWQFKGGGEWPQDARLGILTGRENGILKGIAPLFSVNEDGGKKGYFLGSVEISDYLDFIARPEDLESFINASLQHLSVPSNDAVSALSLANIPEQSPSLQLLQKLAAEAGWSIQVERTDHTPAIQLPGAWDDYLAGIDKKQRHEIRRKLRRADENASLKWYIVSDPETLEVEIDVFFELMALDDAKKEFLSEAMRSQMRAIIQWAFHEGILQLTFLAIDGHKAAAYLCFDANGRILVYNSGFDNRFSQYSPGWVLLSKLIQHAIQTGRSAFDFMRGDEEYKYRFGGTDSFVMRADLKKG